MELVEYQCHQNDRWSTGNYFTNAFVVLNTLFLGYFLVKCYLRLRQVKETFDWENTLLTSKLRTVFAELKSRDRMIDELFTIVGMLDIQMRTKAAVVTDRELKKMRWAIQMLIFTVHYAMPLEPHKVCLDEFMNKEGHSVRTYAEKYIYPEVITTPNDMYNFGLDYLYGTGRAWEKDADIARHWIAKAAEKGHAGAERQLRLLG